MNIDDKMMQVIKQILYVAIKIGQLNPMANIDDLYNSIMKEVFEIVDKEENNGE